MIDFPIVDSHVHLYDTRRLSYAWMKNVPLLNKPHLPADFRAACGSVEIEAFVFVEVWVDDPLQMDEARWVASLMDGEPRLKGLVPSLPLERGKAVEPDLVKLAEISGVKAVRRLIECEPDVDFCLQPGFIEGVRMLSRYDLGFDLCIKHFHLTNAAELVRRCPEVRFVLDHIGKPPIRAGELDPWRHEIRALAALPNVHCKLSGVATEADHENWTREQLRPYLDHAIEVFGFDRLMFGSDWPVSELTHRYETWVEIIEWVASGTTGDELRGLFRDNAVAFYRLL